MNGDKAQDAIIDMVITHKKSTDRIKVLEQQLSEAEEIIFLLYEKESGTTLKSKCWQKARDYQRK